MFLSVLGAPARYCLKSDGREVPGVADRHLCVRCNSSIEGFVGLELRQESIIRTLQSDIVSMSIVPLESGVQNRQTHNCNYTVSRQKIKQVVLFHCDLKNWEIWEQSVSKRSYRKYRERNNHEKAFSPLKDQISSNKLSLIVSTQTCEKRK